MEFFRILEIDITRVGVGDCIERNLTILFLDIRGFSALSEELGSADTYRLLDALMRRLTPVVRECGGYIDKYLGDGFLAVFRGADESLCAALRLQGVIKAYNRERAGAGHKPIAIGVGVNTGPVIIGTLGDSARMDGTLIGHTVNLASRVEGLTKQYGVPIIITGATFDALRSGGRFVVRLLDWVRVVGILTPLLIYELRSQLSEVEGCPADGVGAAEVLAAAAVAAGGAGEMSASAQATEDTVRKFEHALQLYFGRQLSEALTLFDEVAVLWPNDVPTRQFRERISALLKLPSLPEGWDGMTQLTMK